MHLFLIDSSVEGFATLSAEESRHCVRVLRLGVGDEVWATAGDGTLCRARISLPDERACQIEIVERLPDYGHRPFSLHLAVAPTKNTARMEWLVEKAVEIGVDRITPVLCDHSERTTLRSDRLQRVAVSAMKQSLKATLPTIDEPMPLRTLLAQPANGWTRLICHCADGQRQTLHQLYAPGSDVQVLIGPEGDFSPDEIGQALAVGYQPVTLGNSRLRTETAALYALTALNFMNEAPTAQ